MPTRKYTTRRHTTMGTRLGLKPRFADLQNSYNRKNKSNHTTLGGWSALLRNLNQKLKGTSNNAKREKLSALRSRVYNKITTIKNNANKEVASLLANLGKQVLNNKKTIIKKAIKNKIINQTLVNKKKMYNWSLNSIEAYIQRANMAKMTERLNKLRKWNPK